MKSLFVFSVLLTASNAFASEMKPIESYLIDYYRQVFKSATFKTEHSIPDPITEGNINASYLKIYDSAAQLLGYIREVSTTTGCNQICKPLDFTLTFTPNFEFKKLLLREPLTKLDHEDFSENDYAKLDAILIDNPKSFGQATNPLDLVDAVTRATKPAFTADVVPTAALTSFRIYQYEKQTIQHLSEGHTKFIATETPQEAPAFILPDLNGLDVVFDYKSDVSGFKGKVTVLLFFAWIISFNILRNFAGIFPWLISSSSNSLTTSTSSTFSMPSILKTSLIIVTTVS